MGKIILLATWCMASSIPLAYQEPAKEVKKPGAVHDMRLCPVQEGRTHGNERGEAGMGFSQSTTAHHFLIEEGGGTIQVGAKNALDQAGRDNIRHHLAHIAQAFANGDFNIPMFVHDSTPPGVPEMQEQKQKITYSFQETAAGGQVVIRSSDQQALAAIHKFLRYQIEEHRTGDPLDLPSNR